MYRPLKSLQKNDTSSEKYLKLYCMEYDDAMQELYIALLETLPYLNPTKTEAECLNYIKTTVHNRYRFLCRGCLSVPQSESIEDSIDTLSAPSSDESAMISA